MPKCHGKSATFRSATADATALAEGNVGRVVPRTRRCKKSALASQRASTTASTPPGDRTPAAPGTSAGPSATRSSCCARIGDQRQAGALPASRSPREIVDVGQTDGLGQAGRGLTSNARRANENDAVAREHRLGPLPKLPERNVPSSRQVPRDPFMRLPDIDDLDVAVGHELVRFGSRQRLDHTSSIEDEIVLARD